MRQGNNPNSNKTVETNEVFHRVIIPIYIPNEEEYFKDAFRIFKYCLCSLKKTSVTSLKISVISNGSHNLINEKLYKLYENREIDELILETEGIGKINSILKALRTCEERLITITDADVLFCNNWEQEIINIFKEFPKAGAVCPVPVFRKHFQLTSNIWIKYLLSKKLQFLPVKNPEAMTRFAKSIGWPWLDEKYKDVIATLRSKHGNIAVLGCSHFVATYKKEVFTEMPQGNSEYKIRGNSEYLYTDLPVLKKGGYRLSTYDNYAYHMGNTMEEWMTEIYENLKEEEKVTNYPKLKIIQKSVISNEFLNKLFSFFISKKWIKKKLLRYKGLNSNELNKFMN